MSMSKYGKIFLLLLLMTSFAAACSATTNRDYPPIGAAGKTEIGQFTNITVSELQAMLANKDFTFINVHEPYKGHIAQTDAFIPYDQIDQNLEMLPADKGAKIVLYCQGGNMSATGAKTLESLGYTNVYQLVGGFEEWRGAGLPLETQQP